MLHTRGLRSLRAGIKQLHCVSLRQAARRTCNVNHSRHVPVLQFGANIRAHPDFFKMCSICTLHTFCQQGCETYMFSTIFIILSYFNKACVEKKYYGGQTDLWTPLPQSYHRYLTCAGYGSREGRRSLRASALDLAADVRPQLSPFVACNVCVSVHSN